MKLDLNRYTASLPIVKRVVELNPNMSSSDLISQVSIATGCPVVVSGYFIAEARGMDEELEQKIKDLISFYKYDSIIMLEGK